MRLQQRLSPMGPWYIFLSREEDGNMGCNSLLMVFQDFLERHAGGFVEEDKKKKAEIGNHTSKGSKAHEKWGSFNTAKTKYQNITIAWLCFFIFPV